MSPSPRCLVRGSINIDEFFHLPHIVRPGETISSTHLTKRAGGKGANQSYSIAKAGGAVVLDGAVGSDGEWVKELLRSGGVDVGRVRVVQEEVTGRAVIQSSADGENSIVLHKGANYSRDSSSQPDLTDYTHLILQNEIPLDITIAYLRAAASQQPRLTTIFNPSPMLTPSELRSFPWSDLTWLIVNEGELLDLLAAFDAVPTSTSKSTSTSTSEKDNTIERASELIQALNNAGSFAKTVSVICTLGAEGIIYFQPASGTREMRKGHLPAAKLVGGVKDTTGAGDCFAGYFAAGLMRGEELEDALANCLTACAICVEREGAMESVPSLQEVEKRR